MACREQDAGVCQPGGQLAVAVVDGLAHGLQYLSGDGGVAALGFVADGRNLLHQAIGGALRLMPGEQVLVQDLLQRWAVAVW